MKALLTEGATAPEFELPDLCSTPVRLGDRLAAGGALLVFYKTNCPTCQLTLPYLERFHQAYGQHLSVLGISQNDHASTEQFAKDKGDTFPQLLDAAPYPVSDAYGITAVPSMFLLDAAGRIKRVQVAWDRDGMDALSRSAAELAGQPPVTISTEGDGAPAFKPG